ncbi:MAG: tetratricopeptide repeat protein [Candidatus Omnitrophica bacterium]|nr:tetratricopeptide repeat protein [Candidatus Omnitrophota bacterium]MDD5770735.1 tetratricopeptide repeat protein [Candidatus Omnitrophota bacterium]
MALYCQDIGDIDRAIQEYKKALEDDPDSSLLHLSLASAFIRKNELPLAIQELKRSIELEPDAVEPHAILALVYATQNESEPASQEYALALKNASKLDPENIAIYKSLGAVYLQQGKLKEAEGVFKVITGLAAKDEQAHFYLGSIYYDLKDYPAAEREFKTAIKLNPNYHEALNFLGYFYLEQNRNINKAGRMIRKALRIDPENGAYIDSLGWFYFRKGKFKEALSQLEKAASLLSDPVIYDHLGDVFIKLGDPESAKLNWEKSLKLDPAQDQVKEKLFQVCQ